LSLARPIQITNMLFMFCTPHILHMHTCPVNEQDRSAIGGSIAKVVYDVLKEKLCQFQASSDSPPRYAQSKAAMPDDDASVVRVSGLHCIHV